jgi:hypothetical protein
MQPLQKLLHQVWATILPAIIGKLVEFTKMFLKDRVITVGSEMDIEAHAGTPFIYATLDLEIPSVIEYEYPT